MSAGPDVASMLAALQQGGGGGSAGGPPPPQDQGASPDQSSGQTSAGDMLKQILDMANSFLASRPPDLDDQDRLLVEKATTMLQQALADMQKGQHALLNGQMDTRAMARAAGGTGY